MANKLLSYGSLAHLWEIITGKFKGVDRRKVNRAAMRIEVTGHMLKPTSTQAYAYRIMTDRRYGGYGNPIMNLPVANQEYTIDLGKYFPNGRLYGFGLYNYIEVWAKRDAIDETGIVKIMPQSNTWIYTIPARGAVVLLVRTMNSPPVEIQKQLMQYTHVALNNDGKVVLLQPNDIIRRQPAGLGIYGVSYDLRISNGRRYLERIRFKDSLGIEHILTENDCIKTIKRRNDRFNFEVQWLKIKKRRKKNFTPGESPHYYDKQDKGLYKKWKKTWRRQPYGYIRIRETCPPDHKVKGEWKYYKFKNDDLLPVSCAPA